jgi:hypothetical protein
MADERTPLLFGEEGPGDPHQQFCSMIGIPPSDAVNKARVNPRSLYGRATHHYHTARALHAFMATLSTTALLTQVVIGAAVTALGASQSSHILITVFGATNTVIAGIVAYLKSRGQPMRTRMFRDDLERVVDEIENSEVMWLGITNGVHGYDEIDIDDKVTVRSEVARLMRLYERAVRNNMLNNPDNYLLANSDAAGTALRARPVGVAPQAPVSLPAITPIPPDANTAVPVAVIPQGTPATMTQAPAQDPDESPASAPPKPDPPAAEAPKDAPAEGSKTPDKTAAPDEAPQEAPKAAPPALARDPDESPASAANPPADKEPETESSKKDDKTESEQY